MNIALHTPQYSGDETEFDYSSMLERTLSRLCTVQRILQLTVRSSSLCRFSGAPRSAHTQGQSIDMRRSSGYFFGHFCTQVFASLNLVTLINFVIRRCPLFFWRFLESTQFALAEVCRLVTRTLIQHMSLPLMHVPNKIFISRTFSHNPL